MRADLLELICKDLDKEPPFDFNMWVGDDWGGKPDLSCGTTACALGRATTIPEVAALGLQLTYLPSSGYVTLRQGSHMACWDTADQAMDAAMSVFDLVFEEAVYLFMPVMPACHLRPGTNATAAEVAKHIRAFIRRGGLPEEYDDES